MVIRTHSLRALPQTYVLSPGLDEMARSTSTVHTQTWRIRNRYFNESSRRAEASISAISSGLGLDVVFRYTAKQNDAKDLSTTSFQ